MFLQKILQHLGAESFDVGLFHVSFYRYLKVVDTNTNTNTKRPPAKSILSGRS